MKGGTPVPGEAAGLCPTTFLSKTGIYATGSKAVVLLYIKNWAMLKYRYKTIYYLIVSFFLS